MNSSEDAYMKHAIEAVYENGAFRPLHHDVVAIADGQRVFITIEETREPEAVCSATKVYEGLSESEIDEIERIANRRETFFGRGNTG